MAAGGHNSAVWGTFRRCCCCCCCRVPWKASSPTHTLPPPPTHTHTHHPTYAASMPNPIAAQPAGRAAGWAPQHSIMMPLAGLRLAGLQHTDGPAWGFVQLSKKPSEQIKVVETCCSGAMDLLLLLSGSSSRVRPFRGGRGALPPAAWCRCIMREGWKEGCLGKKKISAVSSPPSLPPSRPPSSAQAGHTHRAS